MCAFLIPSPSTCLCELEAEEEEQQRLIMFDLNQFFCLLQTKRGCLLLLLIVVGEEERAGLGTKVITLENVADHC